MKDLIEALNIFLKHAEEENEHSPTHCEHDVFMVVGITKDLPEDDVNRLKELGFSWSSEYDCWASYRYGSA